MVELQSSKLCAWVRFLLFLKILVLKTLRSTKNTEKLRINKNKTPLKNRIRRFKNRFLRTIPFSTSAVKSFTRTLTVWTNNNSFFTHIGKQKTINDDSHPRYHQIYPMFYKEICFFKQQYILNFVYNHQHVTTLVNHSSSIGVYNGTLLNFINQNSSILISKFFNVNLNDKHYLSYTTLNTSVIKESTLAQHTNSATTELRSQDLVQLNTLYNLKRQLFPLSQFNILVTKTNSFLSSGRYHPSYKFKSFYKHYTNSPSELIYKLHMLNRFKSNVFRFKYQDSAYEFYRYKFRFVRIFKGTGWNAFQPGYHQSYYGALRRNHNITSMIIPKPITSLNIFYLQRHLNNDLLTEALFSAAYTKSTNPINFEGREPLHHVTNWRSKQSLNAYLTNALQSLYSKLAFEPRRKSKQKSKHKLQPLTKQTLKFRNLRRLKRRRVFARAPYHKFSTTHAASTNVRYNLLDCMSNLIKGLEASTLLGHQYTQHSNTTLNHLCAEDKPLLGKVSMGLLYTNPLFMKTALTYNFFFKYVTTRSLFQRKAFNNTSLLELNQLFHPYSTPSKHVTNLAVSSSFTYELQRRLVKSFESSRWSAKVSPWYLNTLVRFMEHCSGKKVLLKLNPFIENSLTYTDLAKCTMWLTRVAGFQKLLGPKFFLDEVLKAVTLALKVKDATFFSNWIRGMLKRLSFWKIRVFFRFLKYMMRYVFWTSFDYFQFKGLKICLKGKISVAGNARKRTLLYRIGTTSYSKFDNKISYDFSCIGSFTGVMGFRVWMFF